MITDVQDRCVWCIRCRSEFNGFDVYLHECRRLFLEAKQWATTVDVDPDHLCRPAIHESDLNALPPMPDWMWRLFGPPAPAEFVDEDGGVDRFYQWPHYWLFHRHYSLTDCATPDDLTRWRQINADWLAVEPHACWHHDSDPHPLVLPQPLQELAARVDAKKKPAKIWESDARSLAGNHAMIAAALQYLRQLGSRRAIVATLSQWPDLATYWTMLGWFEQTAKKSPKRGLSALERAMRSSITDPRQPVRNPEMGGPFAGPNGQLTARAIRSFAYWGHKPFVSKKKRLIHEFQHHAPEDPRRLSPSNENRVVALIRLLAYAPNAPTINTVLGATGQTLAVRLYNLRSAGPRERSWLGTRAAIEALAFRRAWDELHSLTAALDDPRLIRVATSLMSSA